MQPWWDIQKTVLKSQDEIVDLHSFSQFWSDLLTHCSTFDGSWIRTHSGRQYMKSPCRFWDRNYPSSSRKESYKGSIRLTLFLKTHLIFAPSAHANKPTQSSRFRTHIWGWRNFGSQRYLVLNDSWKSWMEFILIFLMMRDAFYPSGSQIHIFFYERYRKWG